MEVHFTNSPFEACGVKQDQVVCAKADKASGKDIKAAVISLPAEPEKEKEGYFTLSTDNNLVSAMDLRKFPVGSRIHISGRKIITPLAKDVIRDRKLTIIGA